MCWGNNRLPLLSIIIPTYNEREDIEDTLKAAVNLKYSQKEIIVVDDSTDDTPEIVKKFRDKGIKLVLPAERRGICGAYNLGIKAAKGEILVFLTADVRLEADYLLKVVRYFEQGYDVVLGDNRVKNLQYLYPRFLDCDGKYSHYVRCNPWDWMDGLACRKKCAVEIGGFPETPIPLYGGEDGYFGRKLTQRFKRMKDINLIAYHEAPETTKDFFNQQLLRGRGTPLFLYFMKDYSLKRLFVRTLLKQCFIFAKSILLVPTFIRALRLAGLSQKTQMDILPFFYINIVTNIARMMGEFKGIYEIYGYYKKH